MSDPPVNPAIAQVPPRRPIGDTRPKSDHAVIRTDPGVVLRAEGIHRVFVQGDKIPVLRGVDLDVHEGEFLSIIGSSGSGKTTLLHILGTLDRPTKGSVTWKGTRIDNQSAKAREQYRNNVVGFIFQFYHLLPEFSAVENVLLPQMIKLGPLGYLRQRGRLVRRAKELLDRVGLSHRLKHRPRQLSGGEMQRVAIARAIMNEPEILLADEPTGNLDVETGQAVFELLQDLRREARLTLVLVTHDLMLAQRADRVFRLSQGTLSGAVRDHRPIPNSVAG